MLACARSGLGVVLGTIVSSQAMAWYLIVAAGGLLGLVGTGRVIAGCSIAAGVVVGYLYSSWSIVSPADPGWWFGPSLFWPAARVYLLSVLLGGSSAYAVGAVRGALRSDRAKFLAWPTWRRDLYLLTGCSLLILGGIYASTHRGDQVGVSERYRRLSGLSVTELADIALDDQMSTDSRIDAVLLLSGLGFESDITEVREGVIRTVRNAPDAPRVLKQAADIALAVMKETGQNPPRVPLWSRENLREAVFISLHRAVENR